MKTEQAIRHSEDLITWIDKNIDGINIPSETRFRLAGGCLDVALEHHKAVVLLIKYHLYGSAFAMVRPLFESYVRGVWLHRCASDSDINRFTADKLDSSFIKLIQDVEKLPGFDCGTLSSVKSAAWKAMHSYIHCGLLQVTRRNTESSIEPNYTEGEVLQVINNVNAFALFTAMAIAQLAGNEPLMKDILEKAQLLNQGSNHGVQSDARR